MLSIYCERCGNLFDTPHLQVLCANCRTSLPVLEGPDNPWEIVEHLNKTVGLAVRLGWDYEYKNPELILHHYTAKVKIRIDYRGEEFQGFTYFGKTGTLNVHSSGDVTREYCQERLIETLSVVARRGHG